MISVVILTKNEERNIVDCLATIPDSWEVVIIDDNSIDRTREVAEKTRKNTKIYKNPLDDNFSKQRNFGLEKATGEWILFLDADERLNEKLVEEIELKTRQEVLTGFEIRRIDHMWGKTLRYGELRDMWLVRLAKKESGMWTGAVHEVWNIKGDVGRLKNPLDHYPHATIQEFLSEINFYTTLRAQELHRAKKQVSLFSILLYPKGKFLQNYVLKQGYKDGTAGFVIAVLMSFHSFLVRGKLWLLNQAK